MLPHLGYRKALASGRLLELATTPPLPKVQFSIIYRKERVPPLADATTMTAQAASAQPL